jgi:hypothetical protein
MLTDSYNTVIQKSKENIIEARKTFQKSEPRPVYDMSTAQIPVPGTLNRARLMIAQSLLLLSLHTHH